MWCVTSVCLPGLGVLFGLMYRKKANGRAQGDADTVLGKNAVVVIVEGSCRLSTLSFQIRVTVSSLKKNALPQGQMGSKLNVEPADTCLFPQKSRVA